MKKIPRIDNARHFFALVLLSFFPTLGFAQETAAPQLDLTHHFVGYFALALTAIAYIAAMTEDVIELKKSKPMVLSAALVWFAICIYYAMHGQAKTAAIAFESNLLAYIELLLFILVSMTYLNTMSERGIFDGLRIFLLNKQCSYRQLFWITGALAFVLSIVVNGLTVGLLMGAVALAVGKNQPKFIALACVNIIVGANAGGTMSPLGGISTLFVWQHKILHFTEFFALTIPCLINFLVPASIMHFSVPKKTPAISKQSIALKRGSKRIVLLFVITLGITVSSNVLLELPPAAGMMAGLGLLQFFNFYLTKTEQENDVETQKSFDVFKSIADVDWDTLLFFYGAMMIIGAVGFVGYLDSVAHFLFGEMNVSVANIMIGLSSAFVDNGTLMFAVLSMHPDISNGQWLLLTLTLGVGGSLLAIGSAPGVGLLGQIKEGYSFGFHLRWMPAILLGYFLSIAAHFWVNAVNF
ncbi:MAG: sodium:proton antiporter NhaD [Methylococcales bacterium]|nr:sodium:proton antiporter NhaD [Methylococcales bacterium]MDD5753878.1 sodium:proton antiporter NhaD [Methylococcales bacterium]